MSDIPSLYGFRPVHRLHQPDSQVLAYRLPTEELKAGLPLLRGRRPAFVARSGDRVVGLAQFLSLPPDQRWVLLGLGASAGVYDNGPVLEELLTYAVRSAGLRGVKRLFARVPNGVPYGPALQRLGWNPYATETVYQARGLARRRRGPDLLRRQDRVDTWGIHQLYCAITPRAVQDAEALTSHRWELSALARRRGVTAQAWVADENHDVIAYVGTMSRGGVHLVDLMVRPERREIAPSVIDQAIANLPGSVRRVTVSLRGYQSELAPVLEGRGFEPVMDQDLHLRYTTANVRVPAHEAFPLTVDVRERLPQRVPTFMHGQSSDQRTAD